MRLCNQKIFSIHFPEKRVYIENTCKSLPDKMEKLRMIKIIYYTHYSKITQIQKLDLSVFKMEVVIKKK